MVMMNDEQKEERVTEEYRRRAYVDLCLVQGVYWAILVSGAVVGICAAMFWTQWTWLTKYLSPTLLNTVNVCVWSMVLVLLPSLELWSRYARHPQWACRARPARWFCAHIVPLGGQHYRTLLHLALGLLVVAAVLGGVFWQQCGWLHEGMQAVLASPAAVSVALMLSLVALLLLFVVWPHSQTGCLWPLLLGPVLFFWLLAGGENFCWNSLSGVFWCLGALLLVFLPALGRDEESVPPAQPDTVGRRLLYRRMGSRIRYLVGLSAQKGVTVVVTGPWGSGKSHFINYLAYSLRHLYQPGKKDPMMENAYLGRFKVCSVDLWRSKDKEAMWNDIAAALASAISGRNVQLINRWRSVVIELLQAVHLPVVSLADAILQLVTTGVDGSAAAEGVLVQRINYPKNAYILVLDNLDRCSREKVEALFPLIERLRRIRGLVTICAIAPEALERRCAQEGEPGFSVAQSLLKVFDVSLPLPKVSVKYAVPYLLRLLSDLKLDCPNLHSWILRQKLRFDTPRQMENMIQQLGLLDNCYLRRWNGDERDMQRKESLRMRIDAAFYMSALRVAAPSLAGALERAASPASLVRCTLECLNLPAEQREAAEARRELLQKEWGPGAEDIFRSELLRSLMEALAVLDEESLSYATEQAYLRMSALTDKESSEVITRCVVDDVSPGEALAACFPNEFLPEEEPALYWGVLEYAMDSPYLGSSLRYAELCLQQDILPPQGSYRELLHSPEVLMRLVDTVYHEWSNTHANREKWLQMLSVFAEGTDARTLCAVLNEVAGFPQSGHESHLLQACTRSLFHDLRNVNAPEFRYLEADAVVALETVCTVLYERYACCICGNVLRGEFVAENGVAFLWGKKYIRPMLRSVRRYLAEDKKREVTESETWRSEYYVFCAMPPQFGERKGICCELPYAALWWQIFCHAGDEAQQKMADNLQWEFHKDGLMELAESAPDAANSGDDESRLRRESIREGARYLLTRMERFSRRLNRTPQMEEQTEDKA